MTDNDHKLPDAPKRLVVEGFWNLLVLAGAGVSLCTLLGFMGRFSWVLDLFAHFRVQYLFLLLLAIAVLLLGRKFRPALIFLAFAALNLMEVAPFYASRPSMADREMPSHRAMLINVNTHIGNPALVTQVVTEADPDVLILQEINARWIDQLSDLANRFPYKVVEGREDNFGIGLYSKLPLQDSDVLHLGKAQVPSIQTNVMVDDAPVTVIATHPVPPAGRQRSAWRNDQLAELAGAIPSEKPVILIGDLNATPWSHHFRRLVRESGLKDSARGFGVQPTWPTFIAPLSIPIDHCLHSDDILIHDRRIGEDVASDHFPVIVDFAIKG